MFISFEASLIQCSIIRRLGVQYLRPKQILIHHSRFHNRDVPSAAISWGKAPYDVLSGKFSLSMMISSPCKLPSKTVQSSANQLSRKQRYQMSRERLVCVDPWTTCRILGQKLAFFGKFRHVWYQKKAKKPGLPCLLLWYLNNLT